MTSILSRLILIASGILLALPACTSQTALPTNPVTPPPPEVVSADPISSRLEAAEAPALRPAEASLEEMKFSVQVGAFSELDNAVRLEQDLKSTGVDAYYFRDDSGLYKVRFGNHINYQSARNNAEHLQRQGLIGRFFIVIPEQYTAARIKQSGRGSLRNELVMTVRRYLGVPYLWGGETTRGFDCSGLTMVCYRINGLNLPRNSRSQYRAGRPVKKSQLKKGDLVFFATKGGKRVTHVGMYIGGGSFIHAPRTGKTVRVAKLSNRFFTRTYVGARSYL